MNAVYAKYLAPDGADAPARSTVEVSRLPKDVLIEIELIAELHRETGPSGEQPVVEEKIELSDEEWKKRLTLEQYHVLRESGTERPFSGALNFNKESGRYQCAGCGAGTLRFRSQI